MSIRPYPGLLGFLFLFFALRLSAGSAAEDIIGHWLTANGKAKIEIYRQDGKYHGKIVWLKEPLEKNGQPKVDSKNPDPNFRQRPIIGLPLLRDFSYTGNKVWNAGKIYDPESGNDYSCKMTLKNSATLEVRGYIGISLFGRTEVWTRMETP